ncbi:hypothetical protein K466DRAFT_379855 [Polyporus arcularius HHB13444]|uniref:Uncharacterized protein n=1 Tax=Polyporus arcularius HHB13444 TaxID=1314778 RepID=A0A5C3NUL4_9APHY|nr:hypothetical protein K466DRAFT_379855 [Polyporus arcularius HHB13444]
MTRSVFSWPSVSSADIEPPPELGRALRYPHQPRRRAEASRLHHVWLPTRARCAPHLRSKHVADGSSASAATASRGVCLRTRHGRGRSSRHAEAQEGADEASAKGRRPWGDAPSRPGEVAEEERADIVCAGEQATQGRRWGYARSHGTCWHWRQKLRRREREEEEVAGGSVRLGIGKFAVPECLLAARVVPVADA